MDVRGKSTKQRNLIVRWHDNHKTQDGKTLYLDTQLHLEAEGERQSDPHGYSRRTENGYDNERPFAASQVDDIKKAAGDNYSHDDRGWNTALVKGDLGSARGGGLVLLTKTGLGPSDATLDENTVSRQYAIVKEVSAEKAAARAAEQQAKPEQDSPQADQPEPQEDAPVAEQEPEPGV